MVAAKLRAGRAPRFPLDADPLRPYRIAPLLVAQPKRLILETRHRQDGVLAYSGELRTRGALAQSPLCTAAKVVPALRAEDGEIDLDQCVTEAYRASSSRTGDNGTKLE
jgi:hypothetical protein